MPHCTDDALLLRNQLCFAVYSTAHAFNRLYKPLLETLGLTYPQYLVMMVLWEQDGRAVKDIGQALRLDSGTLTPLLKRLEGMELVRRGRDTQDERVVRITLTEQGRALKDRARAIPEQAACAIGLEVPEIAALRDRLLRLRDTLDAVLPPE